jgi:two-component system, NarL family, sensor kinase
MRPSKFTLLYFVFAFVLQGAMAQNLDSLELCLQNNTLSYDEKIRLYDDLSWENLTVDAEKSIAFAQKGINLAKQEDDKLMVCRLFRYIGVAHYMVNRYDTAFVYLDIAMDLAKRLKDQIQIGAVYLAMANIYNLKGDFEPALDCYLKSLSVFESNNQPARARVILGNIGSLYAKMKNYDQSESYYKKSLAMAIELGDMEGRAQSYSGLSSILVNQDKFDTALEYGFKALEVYRELKNPLYETIVLNDITRVYYKGYKDLKKAREYAMLSLNLAESTGYSSYIASSLSMLSNVTYHSGEFKESVEYARRSFATDTSDHDILVNVLGNLVLGNIQLGNVSDAIESFNLYSQKIQKLSNTEFQEAISEMEVKYDTEKKALKINSLEKQKRMMLYLIISALISLLLLIGIIIYRKILNKKEKMLALQKILQLEQEKKLVATQSVLEGETAERTRLAKDLHDGLGGMLSVVKLNLNGMKNYSVLDTDNVEQFNKTVNMLDNSIKELRRIAHHMMPESLLRYGLKASLSDFCNAVPNVAFHYFGNEQRIDSNLEILIYRSAHELVNNALKHSNASQINVQIVQEPDRLSLTVQDNGVGFDPKIQTSGMGLKSISDRVSTFNGKMNVYAEPQKGTEINIEFNL